MQNRLEQLRKRQRDEAILAQQELLAGTGNRRGGNAKNWGGDMHVDTRDPTHAGEASAPIAEMDAGEAYQREMSPKPFALNHLPPEERQLEIVDELEDRRRLVSPP